MVSKLTQKRVKRILEWLDDEPPADESVYPVYSDYEKAYRNWQNECDFPEDIEIAVMLREQQNIINIYETALKEICKNEKLTSAVQSSIKCDRVMRFVDMITRIFGGEPTGGVIEPSVTTASMLDASNDTVTVTWNEPYTAVDGEMYLICDLDVENIRVAEYSEQDNKAFVGGFMHLTMDEVFKIMPLDMIKPKGE